MSDNSSEDSETNENKNLRIEIFGKIPTFLSDNGYLDSPVDEYMYEEVTPAFPLSVDITNAETVVASESLAVKCLEDLFNNGSITGSEMALYKKKFFLLCQLLEKNRDSEFNLLQLSKRWTIQVEKDNETLASANDFPDDSNTEVSKMRQSLLKYHNDNLAIEDRLETLNYKVVTLEEERKMLENELNRLPGLKDKEMKKKLEDSIHELKKEISDMKIKNKECKEVIKNNEDHIHSCNQEYDNICNQINTLKSKLVETNSLSTKRAKEYDRIRKEMSEQVEIQKICQTQLNDSVVINNELCRSTMLKDELLNRSTIEDNKVQNSVIIVQSQLDEVKKLFEKSRETEAELQLDKVKLEMDLKYLQIEKQKVHDEIISKTKIKDKALKSLKEAKLQLRGNEEYLETIKTLHEKALSDLDLYPKSDHTFKDNIEKKRKEIEHRKKLYDVQNIFSEVEKAKLMQSAQEEERLLYDLSDLRIEVVELTRLAQIKADEREQKAKEFILKEKKFNHVEDELKEKFLVKQDFEKKFMELQVKLDNFAKLYNVMQMDRNKCANLINSVTHKSSEMREKIRILNNEIEILRTNSVQKEKYVQKQRTKLAELGSMRDSLQSEISKMNLIMVNQKEKRDQIQLDIHRLNQLGNQAEETMVHLRRQNDFALQNRNDRAIQLIERNEEVCILQEKYSIKEDIICGGEKEIQARIAEIDFLKQNVKELKREVELLKKKTKLKNKIGKEVVNLRIQIEICRDRLKELELKLENPQEQNRTRILNGDDPSPIEMQYKFEELNTKLSMKEEYYLEKELLLEAVSRLVKGVENKILDTKMGTIELAKCLNDYKFQMRMVIKQLKAKTAELTMNMSKSLQLQQEVKTKDSALKDLYTQIENQEDIEYDNVKVQAKNKQSLDFVINQYQLTNGKLTTAEPRPNAYIPENEHDLPIPRPYGAHAPFRPTEPGSNMRHIKKQKLKPIEI